MLLLICSNFETKNKVLKPKRSDSYLGTSRLSLVTGQYIQYLLTVSSTLIIAIENE